MSATRELQLEDFVRTIAEIDSEAARRQLIDTVATIASMFKVGREVGYAEGFKAGRESAQEEE